LYTRKDGRRYNPDSVVGNVLTMEMLTRIRNIERKLLVDLGPNLRSWKSAIPCFFSNTQVYVNGNAQNNLVGQGDARLSAMPQGAPTEGSVAACLNRIVQAPTSMYRTYLGADFQSRFIGSEASCSALRSTIEVDASMDFDALIPRLSTLSDGVVELTFGGDGRLTWRELYLTLFGDLVFIGISIGAIHVFLLAVLPMPLFTTFSLLVIMLCFPVTIALYLGAFGQEQLPVLSIVSIYLVLGIGSDYVFIFTNTCAPHPSSDLPSSRAPELRSTELRAPELRSRMLARTLGVSSPSAERPNVTECALMWQVRV
jgi:hypothetical protein